MFAGSPVAAVSAGGAAPPEGAMSNGVYVLPSAANGDVKPVVSSTPLVDFLMQLEDYTPTVGFLPEQGYWLSTQLSTPGFRVLLYLLLY